MGFLDKVKKAIPGIGSSIFGTALGAASGLATSELQAKTQYRYAKRMAQNAPGWNMEGLRRAGLNPILAANPAGGSPSAGMPSPDMSLPSVAASSAKSAAEKRLVDQNLIIAENNAITSGANAADALQRMRWNEKTYNYMQENPEFLLKMSSLEKSGYKPKDLGEAVLLNSLMNPSNAKRVRELMKKQQEYKSPAPEYMGIPHWR